jgi:uncharacterized protein
MGQFLALVSNHVIARGNRTTEMREKITEDVKTAMRAGEKDRLSTLRMMQAAIKDRDIANRGTGKDAASDDELLQLFTKMVKQREESASIYDTGRRPELAAKERAEIAFIQAYMPKQLSDEDTTSAIAAIIKATGAASVKDMGKVMAALRAKFAGQMDFGKASGVIKSLLS